MGEAHTCGTSGMKAVFNGCLNMGILDGWWAEAHDGMNGFAIGKEQQHANAEINHQCSSGSISQLPLNNIDGSFLLKKYGRARLTYLIYSPILRISIEAWTISSVG